MVLRLFLAALLMHMMVIGSGGAEGAPSPKLGLPIECNPGKDCWIVNFVDLDPGKTVRDHTCKAFSYDGHKGTDIAIRDMKEMQNGVSVIASAPGVVRGVRDGMRDVDVSVTGKAAVSGKECGNGVVITHGDGWETQYCHMRKGSIVVKKGMRVVRGQKLGSVGLSGLTQFPHVHLSVRHKGKIIDPFNGESPGPKCSPARVSLWEPGAKTRLGTQTSAIYNAGFAAKRPQVSAIRSGLYRDKVLSRSAPALIMWSEIYWPMQGDQLLMQIFGPDEKLFFEHKSTLEKTSVRKFFYAGKKRKPLFWPEGVYRGEITLTRKSADGKPQMFKSVRRVELK